MNAIRRIVRFCRSCLRKRRLAKLRLTIQRIDASTKREGWPNWKRKQLWRDFIRSSEFRDTFVDAVGNVLKEKP